MKQWHTMPAAQALSQLLSNERGLSPQTAARRLQESGPNTLPEPKRRSLVRLIANQFESPLIYVLMAAGAAVFALGETLDAGVIFAVLLFNAIVGAVQEGRAQRALDALRDFVETSATVLRDGQEYVIPDREVVPGDVLIVREGDKIAADARLISAVDLRVDEASLTGESMPVQKSAEGAGEGGTLPAAQTALVFKGTHALVGTGTAVVFATGKDTAIGGIAERISATDTEMPLKAQMRTLSRRIIAAVAGIGAAIFAAGIAAGHPAIEMFKTVVSLSVSIIPEGLPIVMTLVLATGVWRMGKRNALVKRLQAVESLGQASIIAVDKTGTVTRNELVVRAIWTEGKHFDIGGVGYEPKGSVSLAGMTVDAANHPELLFLGKAVSLSANASLSFSEAAREWRISGDPTEAAMLVAAEKLGFRKADLLHESPLLGEIAFDYQLKYHTTLHQSGDDTLLTIAGAPEVVLGACASVREGAVAHRLSQAKREELEAVAARMSGEGLRVIAIAVRHGVPTADLSLEAVHALSFVGLLGMQDALRPEAAGAVTKAQEAGVRVVMITGDNEITARAIAAQAGIWREGDDVLTGTLIDGLSEEDLAARLPRVSVFARVTPDHKLRIISAFKARGEIVAMTGDGVNDAPSLVAADLGVAMGKIGTEVAKEASDIVLLDDNFGSIVSAIEEGRSIYKTIKKVILYLFSTSAGEVLTIAVAILLGYPLPLLAAQIIWLNLVTDGFLDVALAMEPKEEGLLRDTFGPQNRHLVDMLMLERMAVMALPMMIGALYLFSQYAQTDIAKAGTVALTVLAVFQWFNAWNCRSDTHSIFRQGLFANTYLIGATVVVVFLQLCAVYLPPFQALLHTVPLTAFEWAMIVLVASSVVVVEEIRKLFHRRLATA